MIDARQDRRVVITGLGVVAPCGTGVDEYWSGLAKPVEPAVVRRVPDLDPESIGITRVQGRRIDRFTTFALVAAAHALVDAGLTRRLTDQGTPAELDGERCAVVLGTGIGGVLTWEPAAIGWYERGPRVVSPLLVPMAMPNAAPAAVALRWGLYGPCETVATACASSTHAIGSAARLIASGRAQTALTGGTEACLAETALAGFSNMRALSSSGISRPFDGARDGFCAAEGAGVLVLEEARHAQARGARIYAEIVGVGATTDAHHLTAPAPQGVGAARCMRLAIQDAGLRPEEITHVNAHGTSTSLNDLTEAQAIGTVFGDHRPAVTSIKGVTGHALGAAGALEAVALAMSYAAATLPPTMGTTGIDPQIDLDVVVETRPWTPTAALSNSFAFGGHNGTLVFAPAR